jgi:glycosyltransferase involved in cell wall biosynthesis
MNIFFLMRTLGRGGGAEQQLTVLAKGLHSYGHQVTVAILYGGGDFEIELVNAGVNIIDLKKKGFWDIIGFFYRYFKVLKEQSPEVLHGYMPLQNLLVLLGRFVLPKAKVVWGLRDSNIGFGSIPFSVKIIFKLTCWLSHKTDLIISNSEAGKLFHVSNGYPDYLIKVVHNGIDTDYFQRNASARQRLRGQWGVSDAHLLIGNIGRLDRKKDHPVFFRACAIVQKKHPNIKIVYAGEDSIAYRTELEALIKELQLQDKVIWAGECHDMPSLYSALDVEVSSSRYEGFPNVVAEAMSCQVPVVATEVGDVKLMLDKIGGRVPPGDPQALADAITKMLQSDLSEIGQRSREIVVDRYSVEKLVKKSESLLMKLSAKATE